MREPRSDSETEADRFRVFFNVRGEHLNPDEVTRVTGLTPSDTARKGERPGTRSSAYPVSTWSLDSLLPDDSEPAQQVSELLGRLAHREADMERFRKAGAEVFFWVSYFRSSKHACGGFELPRDLLRRCGELGADVMVSVVT